MIADCAVYENGERASGSLRFEDAGEAAQKDGAFVWLGVVEPDEEELQRVADEFDLHELAVEDAVKAHQRPKAEIYGDTLFVVVKTAHYDDNAEHIEIGELMLFVNVRFVITVRHGGVSMSEIRDVIESRSNLLGHGPSAVLHGLLDHVVDNYENAATGVSVDVEEIERVVFSGERMAPTQRIYRLEREVLALNSAVAPFLSANETIRKAQSSIIPEAMHDYFRDVSDHLQRVNGHVGTLRELLSSVLQANLTQVSVQQNNDMRTISAWVAIAAVPTMIAGIYGMNFEHMPELQWQYGYPLMLSVTSVVCLGLYWRFKAIDWL